jgi:hypothetical protein
MNENSIEAMLAYREMRAKLYDTESAACVAITLPLQAS